MSRLLLACLLGVAACSVHSLDYLGGYGSAPATRTDGPSGTPLPPERDASPPPDAARPDAAPADLPPPLADAAAPDAGPPPADADAPDSSPAADAAQPTVFFIVGASPLSPGDTVIERHLRLRGLRVLPVVDEVLGTVDTGSGALIFVSQTARVGNVGARFRDVARPVIVAEPLLYDDMGMVDSTVAMGVNRDLEMNVTTLRIDSPGDPRAAGLSGNVAIVTAASLAGWGTPNMAATRVASLLGQPEKVAIFTYDTGAAMPELAAPARRIGLFLSDQGAAVLNPQGFALLDAAINWALSM
jgi:hypothetical protein